MKSIQGLVHFDVCAGNLSTMKVSDRPLVLPATRRLLSITDLFFAHDKEERYVSLKIAVHRLILLFEYKSWLSS